MLKYFSEARRLLQNLHHDSSVVCETPFQVLRGGIIGLPFDKGGIHPFVMMAHQILNAAPVSVQKSALWAYLEIVRPASSAEILLAQGDMHLAQNLTNFSPMQVALPWREALGTSKSAQRKKIAVSEAKRSGWRLTLADGWSSWGPASEDKVSFEMARLESVLRSIQQHGFSPLLADSPAIGHMLVDRNHYCVVLIAGHHRAAALAALGHKSMPVIIKKIIGLDGIRKWPAVRLGHTTVREGEAVFERMIRGIPPACCECWVNESVGFKSDVVPQ